VALGSDMLLYYHVFFFQAEDGIRDRNVTGVQTCALPISCCRGWPSVSVAKPGNTRGQYRPLLCGAVYRNKSGQPYPRASRVISPTLGFLPEIDIATSLVIAVVVVAGVVLLARRPDVALRTRKSRGSRQRRKAMNTSPSSTTSGGTG